MHAIVASLLPAWVLRAGSVATRSRAELGALMVAVTRNERSSACKASLRLRSALPVWVFRALPMMGFVRRIGNDLQILRSVVGPISVDVVDNLAGIQRASEHFAGDKTVLKNVTVRHRIWMVRAKDHPVTVTQHWVAADPFLIIFALRVVAAKVSDLVSAPDAPCEGATWGKRASATTSAFDDHRFHTNETVPCPAS